MYSTIKTAVIDGICAKMISVEVDISTGMPVFDMVGSLAVEVKEGKERVKTALHNCGIMLPAKRMTINLSPAKVRKHGTGFDLPIAIALLVSLGIIEQKQTESILFAGELGLNGQLLPIPGILPIVSDAKKEGVCKFFVPTDNLGEARLVQGVQCYGFSSLKEVLAFFQENRYHEPQIDVQRKEETSALDFSEVYGQSYLKRVCEISAGGMHNLLMIGPPGAGKTMISERIATILPPLCPKEQLELAKIYSVCGKMETMKALPKNRPFRSPHHTITKAGLIGGGRYPKPGEISMAHHGILFLDELPEFQKNTLEVLRQPMEEKCVHIGRAEFVVDYPADFLLIASMNPCACGNYPDMQKCRCTPGNIRKYLSNISQPLLDRMDLCVEAPRVRYEELRGGGKQENSQIIRSRVMECHELQRNRFLGEGFSYNSQIPAPLLEKYCKLGTKEERYLHTIYEKMGLTARTFHKLLRVARTIADMEKSNRVKLSHLNEAVCYRSVDEKYWGGICG